MVAAYGWLADISDEDALRELLALNADKRVNTDLTDHPAGPAVAVQQGDGCGIMWAVAAPTGFEPASARESNRCSSS